MEPRLLLYRFRPAQLWHAEEEEWLHTEAIISMLSHLPVKPAIDRVIFFLASTDWKKKKIALDSPINTVRVSGESLPLSYCVLQVGEVVTGRENAH